MLKQLHSKGPFTVGIFRKSANARVTRELKAQLEEEPNTPLDDISLIVVASVLKVMLPPLHHINVLGAI